ncbi:MAG: hypothetical protein M1823_003175 [Watsoniomyces obsoletus]|nr:MAG: hypothetical protein M1823_003175 [Watsoniomyces obsoletus]
MAPPSPEPGSPLDTNNAPGPSSPPLQSPSTTTRNVSIIDDPNRSRASTNTSSRLRRASTRVLEANPPSGMWHAAGHVASKIPTVNDIRHGSFSHKGWSAEGQRSRSRSKSLTKSNGSKKTTTTHQGSVDVPKKTTAEHGHHHHHPEKTVDTEKVIAETIGHETVSAEVHEAEKGGGGHHHHHHQPSPPHVYPNGYTPPPKHTWGQATHIALKGFWRFVITPSGFLITIYCLNVVAWGGMLFLLLLNAAPAMCTPTCSDLQSPRRKWIEIDSQILNALFCVTGFGLIPWRFRDFYYLLKWRLFKNHDALRVLAGIHRGWFRLEGSEKLPPTLSTLSSSLDPIDARELLLDDTQIHALPIPLQKAPDPPLTGERAPPTTKWRMDFVVWMYVLNTFLQAVLCGFMWGYNRYDRPSWSTGTFVALACIVAGLGGVMVFIEGKKVKKVEGVPVTEDDLAILEDLERGRK